MTGRLPSTVLTDPSYRVPVAPPADAGVAWLRGAVVRFSEDDDHRRRRALVEYVLDDVRSRLDVTPGGAPVVTLLAALGLPADLADDVALVARAYQPHAPQGPEADAAADRLVAAVGARDELTAARIAVLVQAHAACAALVEVLAGRAEPPAVPATRRIAPDGSEVEVDLSDAPFGLGHHACPAGDLGTALAQAAPR